MIELNGKRVLLTGGHGFLGKYLHKTLHDRGAQVHLFHSSAYDLRLMEDANAVFHDCKPEIVVHAAARVGGIGANQRWPADFFLQNLIMGLHVLEASRQFEVKKLVIIGTTCSYPHTPPSIPFKEEDLFNGYPEPTNAPYGIAKRTLIAGALAYRKQYGLNAISLIPTNMYGPGDNFNPDSSHVIPALILKFTQAQKAGENKVYLWGTGQATRSFIHAQDAAEGIVLAIEKYDGQMPVNLAQEQETSIDSLAKTIAKMVGFTGEIVWDRSKPDGQPVRCLNTSLARSLFGFSAKTDFIEGLKETIEWWKGINNA